MNLVYEVLMHTRAGNYIGNIHFKSLAEYANYNKSLQVIYSPPNLIEANPLTYNEVQEQGYSELTLLI
jgi:hypothetical protein